MAIGNSTSVLSGGAPGAGVFLTSGGKPQLGVGGTAFTNMRFGTTQNLSTGTAVVADAGATANTKYFFTTKALGTLTSPVSYMATTRSAGVSFTIVSQNLTDTSTVDWVAIEP